MAPRTVSAAHGWTWVSQGFALFRKGAALWLALLLFLYAATSLLRVVWLLGIIFVLLMPVFIAGLMEGCRALEHGKPLQAGHLLSGFRKNAAQLVTIGGISLVGNLAIMMIVFALGGEAISVLGKLMAQKQSMNPQLALEVQAAAATVGRALLVGTLASLPLLMALWYAPLLIYFHDMGPLAAMKSSFMACLKNTGAMLVYGLLILAGMFLAMPFGIAVGQYDVALWLLAPVVIPSIYASYKDIYLSGAAPQTGIDSVTS